MSEVIPIGSDHAGETGFAGGRHTRRVAKIDQETG
jgi:hypothetical protein